MRPRLGLSCAAALLLCGLASPSHAALVFYTDRAAFNAANPGLPVETFEEARVNPGASAGFNAPLSAATRNAVFSPGDILPGLTVSGSPFGPGTMLALGGGVLTGTSKVVGNSETFPFNDYLRLTFAPGVHAAGADFYAALRPGDSLPGTLTVEVFDTSGLATGVLGEFDLNLAARAGGFFGVTSTVPIGRISAGTSNDLSYAEFVDNVTFGEPAAVPEPGGLALLAIGIAGLRGLCRRRA